MQADEYETMMRVEETHPWFVNRRRLMLGLIRRFAAHLVSPRILDAGSGTGVNLREYGELGWAVGVEYDARAAALSLLRGHQPVCAGDLCHLPFRDGSFDIIASTDVIEHIRDDVAALRELRRVLADDGRIFLTTPAYSWAYSSHDQFLHHQRRYDLRMLRDNIAQAGLKLIHATRYNVLLAGPVVAARWLGDRINGARPTGSDVGRPIPTLAAPALNLLWRFEARIATQLNWRIGLTHAVVLARSTS